MNARKDQRITHTRKSVRRRPNKNNNNTLRFTRNVIAISISFRLSNLCKYRIFFLNFYRNVTRVKIVFFSIVR